MHKPNPAQPLASPAASRAPWPRVRDLVRRHRHGVAVLRRFGLDPAPPGDDELRLDEACRDAGVRPEDVLDELALRAEADPMGPWSERTLEALVRHLVVEVRGPLEGDLRRLESAARELCRGHGCAEHGRLRAVMRATRLLAEEVRQHLERERRVLYPLVAARPDYVPRAPLGVLSLEHRLLCELVDHVRDLAAPEALPLDAQAAWADLQDSLGRCRHAVVRHARLEDELLYPRMLRGAWE